MNGAADLITMVRLGVVPESWPAPPPVRELRELGRYRAKLVGLRSGLEAQTQATLSKHAVRIPGSQLWGSRRQALIADAGLADERARVSRARGPAGS